MTLIGASTSAKPDCATPPNDVAPEGRAALGAALSAKTRAPQDLLANGLRRLAKRFRTPHDAFDLVAKRRGLVASLLPARPALGDFEPRVKAIAIAPRHWPRHLLAAFVASSSPLTRGRPR